MNSRAFLVLAAATALVGCSADWLVSTAEASRRRRRSAAARGTAVTSTQVAFTHDQIAGAELALPTHSFTHMCQEATTSDCLTHPTGMDEPVGRIADPAQGHIFEAPTATARPTVYTTDIGSALRFNATDVDRLIGHNSQEAFAFIHQNGIGTIAFWYRVFSDGANRVMVANSDWSSTNEGFAVARTSGNRLQFQVFRGSGGTFIYNFTTSAAIAPTAALGWRQVAITFNGSAGGTVYFCTPGSTCIEETFAYTGSAFSAGLPTRGLTWGSTGLPGNACDCAMANMVVSRYPWDDAQVDAWRAPDFERGNYNLVRTTTNTCGFNFCFGGWDFTQANGVYESGCTDEVEAASDIVTCARPLNDENENTTYPGHLNRELVDGGAGTMPLWLNSSNGIEFDGSNDTLNFQTGAQWSRPAIGNAVLVRASNDDLVNGSEHFANGTTSGEYGQTLADGTWTVGTTAGEPFTGLALGNGIACRGFHRDASSMTIIGAASEETQTIAGITPIAAFGGPSTAGYNQDGFLSRIIIVQADLTTAQLQSRCP